MSAPLFEMIVFRDEEELARHPLEPGDYLVGSQTDCRLVIDAAGVAPKHARLGVSRDGRVNIEDYGSNQGTHLDGLPIVMAAWLPGQLVKIGGVTLELRHVAQELPAVAAPAADAEVPLSKPAPTLEEELPQPAAPVLPPAPRAPTPAGARSGGPAVRQHRKKILVAIGAVGVIVAALGYSTVQQRLRTQHELADTPEDPGLASARALFTEAHAEFEKRDFPDALRLIDRAIALAPGEALYQATRGHILLSLGQLSEAAQAYDQTLHLQPDHRHALEGRDLCRAISKEQNGKRDLTPPQVAKLNDLIRRQGRPGAVLQATKE